MKKALLTQCCICKLNYICGDCAYKKFNIENLAKHICSNCYGKSNISTQDANENTRITNLPVNHGICYECKFYPSKIKCSLLF